MGTNTTHAIQSGVFHGYVGLVRHLVAAMGQELPAPVRAIATGGQAAVMASAAACFSTVEPWLVLEGLRIVAKRALW